MIPTEALSKELEDILVSCKKNAENLATMVTNILDYAKIKAHKLALNLEPISIKELVENVVDMHKIKAG